MQDLLREQPTHTAQIDLVQLTIDMVVAQCETLAVFKKMDGSDYDLLCAGIDALVEMVQGEGGSDYVVRGRSANLASPPASLSSRFTHTSRSHRSTPETQHCSPPLSPPPQRVVHEQPERDRLR